MRRKLLRYTDRVSVQSVRGSGYALTLASNRVPIERLRHLSEARRCTRSTGGSSSRFWAALAPILVGTVTVCGECHHASHRASLDPARSAL